MEKEFVPYTESLLLKELGFDEPCFGYFTGDLMHLVIRPAMSRVNEPESYVVTAPLYQQAFRWFRENYSLYGTIRYGNNELDKSIYLFPCINGIIVGNDSFKTQEEAELECLKKLIEITNEKI